MSYSQEQLKAIFGRFAGQEVPMTSQTHETKFGDEVYKYEEHSLADPNHPVLADLHAVAAQHRLSLRIIWPGIMCTADYREDRLNVHIDRDPTDSKWKIKNFGLG